MRGTLFALALALLALALLAPAARADTEHALRDVVLPGAAAFADSTAALADLAATTCAPETLRPAFHAAMDAWLSVSALTLGPAETDGRGLAISFWPDPKGLGAKAQRALLTGDPSLLDPAPFAAQSVAARGFSGLERLLWPPADLPADPCPLIRATTADLARMAAGFSADWSAPGGFADLMLTAGAPGNPRFLTPQEARQALFTQIVAALDFTRDQRLGRPLATFDRPRPDLSEQHLSGRPIRNVIAALTSLRSLITSLTPDAPLTVAALDRALLLARLLSAQGMDGIATPSGWLKVQILQQAVDIARFHALQEVARDLDVDMGFNSADGD